MIDTTLLNTEIKSVVESYCKTENYSRKIIFPIVDSDDFTFEISNSDMCFILNDKINLPESANVVLSSADNFLSFGKREVEQGILELEKFSNYLNIKTENYGTTFIPYKLKLLIITPLKK